MKNIAKDIIYLKSILASMAGIVPFIYHLNTPIENTKDNFFELSLKAMAIVRLLMPVLIYSRQQQWKHS